MGAVSYTSNLADHALYESEREREYRHLHLVPAVEREEIRQIYERKGFSGPLLDRIVDTITADKDVWVGVMMAEEHQLTPIDRGRSVRSALIVGLSAIVGSLVPLAPFLLLPIQTAMAASVVLAAAALFGVGAYKAKVTVGHAGRSGLEMAMIGTLSALAGYVVGLLFRVPVEDSRNKCQTWFPKETGFGVSFRSASAALLRESPLRLGCADPPSAASMSCAVTTTCGESFRFSAPWPAFSRATWRKVRPSRTACLTSSAAAS